MGMFSSRKTTVVNTSTELEIHDAPVLSSTRKHLQPSFQHAHSLGNARLRNRLHKSKKEADSATMNRKPATIVGEPQECKSVFFWGGGKAGSTTLARLLKNHHNNSTNEPIDDVSQFIDLGKEVCWAFKGGHERWLDLISNKCSSEGHQFALDGCPRYLHPSHASAIAKHYPNDAKFLMLVRNPIDRLVSHLNDQYGWRGGGKKLPKGFIDRVAKKMAKQVSGRASNGVVDLSLFGRNLRNLLKVVNDPKQVLIIQTDAMKRDPQQVMDNVMDHIGGHRMEQVDVVHANNGKSKGDYEYQFVSDETKEELQQLFTSDVKLLESLLGRTFAWSWTNSTVVDQDSSWLTTYPNLQLHIESPLLTQV